jgi:hypothetical protein
MMSAIKPGLLIHTTKYQSISNINIEALLSRDNMAYVGELAIPLSESDNFLIEACRIAQGDTQKNIEVTQIRRRLNLSGDIDQMKHPHLIGGYIKGIQNRDEITVTRKGFYYALKKSGISPSNFGMVSYKEAKTLSFEVLKHLCKKTVKKEEINIWQIKISNYLGDYGGATLSQVADILLEQGFIRYLDDTGRINITPKAIKQVARKLLLS